MPSNNQPAASAEAIEFANIGYDSDDVRAALTRWAHGRPGMASLDATSLEQVVDLHRCVCGVFDGCLDDDMLQHLDAVVVVNGLSSATPVSPVLVVGPDGTVAADIAQPAHGLASVLAGIARSVIHVVTTSADQLRRCEAPGCSRYFLKDRAHRNWCSLGCGNRARVARHYARHTSTERPIVSNSSKGHRP